MTDQPETRKVTLMVTHPDGTGHRTLDHHIPVEAADALEDLVIHLSQSVDGPGGRYVALFSSAAPWAPAREVDDATAEDVIAAMNAHMPERTYRQRAEDADRVEALADEWDRRYGDTDPEDRWDRGHDAAYRAVVRDLRAVLGQPAEETP
jgi:hypothetical protein